MILSSSLKISSATILQSGPTKSVLLISNLFSHSRCRSQCSRSLRQSYSVTIVSTANVSWFCALAQAEVSERAMYDLNQFADEASSQYVVVCTRKGPSTQQSRRV